MIVGASKYCDLLSCMCDLKTKFKLNHNMAEKNPKIICGKIESSVFYSKVTGWFKKFHSSHKNIDDQARSDWRKSVNSEALIQAMKANPANSS